MCLMDPIILTISVTELWRRARVKSGGMTRMGTGKFLGPFLMELAHKFLSCSPMQMLAPSAEARGLIMARERSVLDADIRSHGTAQSNLRDGIRTTHGTTCSALDTMCTW